MGTDFWFDEVWSHHFSTALESPFDAIFKLHHDNSHPLNTMFMVLVGDHQNWVVYRLPSLVFGVIAICVIGLIAQRRSKLAAVTAMALAAASFPLILYSSEARGYSGAVLCGLLGFLLLSSKRFKRRLAMHLAFWVVVALGYLSHLTFAYVHIGLGVWSLLESRSLSRWRLRLLELARWHLVPATCVAALYLVHVQYMVVGGAGPSSWGVTVLQALAFVFGVPSFGLATIMFVAAGIGIVGRAFVPMALRKAPHEAAFYAVAILVAPVIVILVSGYAHPQVRYFVVCMPFILILTAYGLCHLYELGRLGRVFYGVLLAGMIVGNSTHVSNLLDHGRGQYANAVKYMANATPSKTILVASDHELRNGLLLAYYGRALEPERRLVYVAWESQPEPHWLITHHFEPHPKPKSEFVNSNGTRYRLSKIFRAGLPGLSGWHWAVYARDSL